MKFSKLFIFLFFLINFKIVLAEETTSISSKLQNNDHAIGISAGTTSGIGLSYRYQPGKNGLQLTLLPVKNYNRSFISFGASYLRMLREHEKMNVYLNISSHIRNEKTIGWPHGQNESTYLSFGVGPSFEINLWDIASFNFMFGYGAYNILGFYGLITNLTGEVGFYYWF